MRLGHFCGIRIHLKSPPQLIISSKNIYWFSDKWELSEIVFYRIGASDTLTSIVNSIASSRVCQVIYVFFVLFLIINFI